MKYKAVLFDMDGVIVDSEPLHVAAFREALRKHGYELSEKEYTRHFAGKTDEAGFKQYFSFINETVDLPIIMDQKAKEYLKLASDQLTPYPNIIDVIQKLSIKVSVALVTGSLRAEVDIVLTTFEIETCFKTVLTADDITASKPDPEGYCRAASTLNIDPAECVVVEDSPSGIEAALAAGMDCIAVTNTHSAQDLKKATRIVDAVNLKALEL